MEAGHWARWGGPVGLGTGVGDDTGVAEAGGGVGTLAAALPAAVGAADPPLLEQAARNAENPASAVPWRKRRRVRSRGRSSVARVSLSFIHSPRSLAPTAFPSGIVFR